MVQVAESERRQGEERPRCPKKHKTEINCNADRQAQNQVKQISTAPN